MAILITPSGTRRAKTRSGGGWLDKLFKPVGNWMGISTGVRVAPD